LPTLPSPIRAVTLELTQARLDVFDPRATVEFLAARGVNTIVCFAVGYGRGEAYYPSALAPEHPLLHGRDLFGEVCDLATERGLATVAYVNGLFGGPEFFTEHPDWTQRWADGRESTQTEAKMLCPNSPYGAHIVAVSAEVAERYPIAGFYLDEPSLQSWCACPFCHDRYRRDTGHDLPLSIERGTPEFARFLSWREGVVTGFVGAVADAVRAARPGVAFFAQHAFPMASTAQPHLRRLFWGKSSGRTPPQWEGWYRPSFYGQNIAAVAQSLDLVGIEPWRRFVGQPAWWPGACVSYARSAGEGKPVLPLMEYPHFPWGLGRLTDSELAVNCADVIANGGDLWFPMYAPDDADREGWDTLNGIFASLDGVRLHGAEQIAPVGILFSRLSAERYGADDVEERYLDDVIGTIQLVRELGLPYRVLAEDTLSGADFAATAVLIAPSAATLRPETADLIRDWVQSGGRLIGTGWVATHDETGAPRDEPLLTDVFGARLGPDSLHAGMGYLVAHAASGLPAGAKLPVRDEQPAVTLAGAETLFDVLPSWELFAPPADGPVSPSVTVNAFGQGKAVYCGIQLGRLRRRFELFEARRIVRAILGALEPVSIPIAGEGLAPEVGLHAWRVRDVLHLILVNGTSLEATGRAAPLAPQTVRVDRALLPSSPVVASKHGSQVTVSANDRYVDISVDGLRDWDCLIVSGNSGV
jgi:hypothetical protein